MSVSVFVFADLLCTQTDAIRSLEINYFIDISFQKDLVCDQSFLPSIAKVIFFAGVFVGAFVFGNLSDM